MYTGFLNIIIVIQLIYLKAALLFRMDLWGEQHLRQSWSVCLLNWALGMQRDWEVQPRFSSLKHFTERAKSCSGFCVVYAGRICGGFSESRLYGAALWECLSSGQWNPAADARVKSGWEEWAWFAEVWLSCAEVRCTDLPCHRACVTDDSNGKSLC